MGSARSSAEGVARAALDAHRAAFAGTDVRDLFARDPDRVDRFTIEAAGLVVDFSRHLADAETLSLLVALAESAGLSARRDAMFGGARVNRTEDRAALHVALRMPVGSSLFLDGVDVEIGRAHV